jgi:hypothetical protein
VRSLGKSRAGWRDGLASRSGYRHSEAVIVDQVPDRSELRGELAAGTGCAVAGHLVAGGPWLYTGIRCTFYAAPDDSVFVVACLTGVVELMLFVACVTLGVGLLRSRWRQFGIGLLSGWLFGAIAVLCGGTALIALFAAVI